MAFSSALAIWVLARSDNSTLTSEFVPPAGGLNNAAKASIIQVQSIPVPWYKDLVPDLIRRIQRSVVFLCQSSAIGRVKI